MCRGILLSALLCLVCSPLSWCQSYVSLTRLIETGLVQHTAIPYLIVPAKLNGEPGQGKYYLVFYMGVASPSSGVVSQVSGYVAVERADGVYTVVNSIPCRDGEGNVVMVSPFVPDVSRGDENFLLYTKAEISQWVRSYNVVLTMLPWSLSEFQAVMGNNRQYEMIFLAYRDTLELENELEQWDDFFDDGGVDPSPIISGDLSAGTPYYLKAFLFFICVLCGMGFFRSFMESFEGSF